MIIGRIPLHLYIALGEGEGRGQKFETQNKKLQCLYFFNFLADNESSATIISAKKVKCGTFEDTFTTWDKNEDTSVNLVKLCFILIFINFLHSLVEYDYSPTIIAVEIGKCDNFEDTFTKWDENENTRVSLVKFRLRWHVYEPAILFEKITAR